MADITSITHQAGEGTTEAQYLAAAHHSITLGAHKMLASSEASAAKKAAANASTGIVLDATNDDLDFATVDAAITNGEKVPLLSNTISFGSDITLTYGNYIGEGATGYGYYNSGTEIVLANGVTITMAGISNFTDVRIEKNTASTASSLLYNTTRSRYFILQNAILYDSNDTAGKQLEFQGATGIFWSFGFIGPLIVMGSQYGVKIDVTGDAWSSYFNCNNIDVHLTWPVYSIYLTQTPTSTINEITQNIFTVQLQTETTGGTADGITSSGDHVRRNIFIGTSMDWAQADVGTHYCMKEVNSADRNVYMGAWPTDRSLGANSVALGVTVT